MPTRKLTLLFTLLFSADLALTTQSASGLGRTGTLVPPSRFELGSHVTAAQVRDALGLNASDVISITFGTSSHDAFDVLTAPATSFPVQGGSYFVMSSGSTASAFRPNAEPDLSTELAGLNTTAGEDLVQIVIQLRPPAGATCLAFDFAFYSEEFPEFVGSQYNDAFIAEVGQSTFQIVNNQVIAPNNFAFDTANRIISINTVFGVTSAASSGTTYDAGTPLLTAVTPLEVPGAPVTITLSIMDLGDSIYDSTAFIDNFRWFFGLNCRPGADADSDGDALLDDWERNGIDFNRDGTVDLDLPAMGADPRHKDIFVEIDYMVLAGVGGHTHRPKMEALQTVIDSFNAAPVTNPDGTTGIRIHIDAGANTIMNPVTGALWGTRSRSDELAHVNNLGTATLVAGNWIYNWTGFDGIKGVGVPGSFTVQRADVFHYCIFGHSLATELTTTSGIARDIPSSDFLVTLGGWTGDVGSVNEQAGTLMHELGHGLGLRHGGNDHGNFKPNYLSIMNYAFQTRGLRIGGTDGHFDYSRFALPMLNESALNENIGIMGVAEAAMYGTRYFDNTATMRLANNINGPIDWNFNGVSTDNPVAVNINNSRDSSGTATFSILNNSDNWEEIVFDGGAVGHLGEMIVLPATSIVDEIDETLDLQIPTEFKVKVCGPGSVLLVPCQTQLYTYQILNMGTRNDTYALTVNDTRGWADISALPATLALASGQSATFIVPVTVPATTPAGTVDELSITATSSGNPLMLDAAETKSTADIDTPPTIVCPANVIVEFMTDAGTAAVSFEPTVMDNCPATTVCIPASGDAFPIGTTVVTCTVTDVVGQTATCSFNVTVLGPRGVKLNILRDLEAVRSTLSTPAQINKLDEAIRQFQDAVDPRFWIDETHLDGRHAAAAFHAERQVASRLRELLDDSLSASANAALRDVLNRLLRSDRLLAVVALNEAIASGGNARLISKATDELAAGDADAAQGKYGTAAQHYENAWKHVQRERIMALALEEAGRISVEFFGHAGSAYTLQASPNLKDWQDIQSVRAPADGLITFVESPSEPSVTRYYRVVER